MRSLNNDHNINRVYTKMSEDFHHENNTNLPESLKSISEYYEQIDDINSLGSSEDEEINQIDHMYSTNDENSRIKKANLSLDNCQTNQTAESEVKFIKEWLILHTDLIQQQNDDILDKDREIYILRKENAMLRERINCFEKGIPFNPELLYDHKEAENSEELSEDMTHGACEEETKHKIEFIDEQTCGNDDCSVEIIDFKDNHIHFSDNESQLDSSAVEDLLQQSELETENKEESVNELSGLVSSYKSDLYNYNNSIENYNFTINTSDFDPMKNLRMSIRRKRVFSNSSAISHNENSIVEENETYRRYKKKKRRPTKDLQGLTSTEPYITQAHEVNFGINTVDSDLLECTATTLEVPRWRHKIYASCYTMEGTENLDDEVFNKRHMRLENDERRRKRWDVQRIREQRVIDKLKQRQERVGSGSKGEDNEPVHSLWPKMDDVKYVEVCDELPVAAFGNPVPNMNTSEFNLPWLDNPMLLTKKTHSRRSTVKRKMSKR